MQLQRTHTHTSKNIRNMTKIEYSFHLQSTCVLSALNLTDENAIISVRLQNYSNVTPMEAFDALKVIYSIILS